MIRTKNIAGAIEAPFPFDEWDSSWNEFNGPYVPLSTDVTGTGRAFFLSGLVLDGDTDKLVTEDKLPGGFDALPDYVFSAVIGMGSGHDADPASSNISLFELSINETIIRPGFYPGAAGSTPSPFPLSLSGLTTIQLLDLFGTAVVFQGFGGDSHDIAVAINFGGAPSAHATGGYFAPSWWWQLAGSEDSNGSGGAGAGTGRDACGNLLPSAPYLYTSEDPSEASGYLWEKIDPDDQSAHPTPAILSLQPDHGRVQGGETVTIIGSGFGTEATVTVDGSDLDPGLVNVIDKGTIQFTSPAHIAGYVSIVVTNVDGFSS